MINVYLRIYARACACMCDESMYLCGGTWYNSKHKINVFN